MAPRPPSPSGLHPASLSDLRYLNYLINSLYWEILPLYRHQLEQQKALHRKTKNRVGLTVDIDRAKRYDFKSCSGRQKPTLTGPETAPDELLYALRSNVAGSSRKRSGPLEENVHVELRPGHQVKRRRPSPKPAADIPTISVPSSGLFSRLVQLQRSSAVPTVIRRYHGRWILAKVEEDSGPSQSCNFSCQVINRQIVTIRVPVVSHHSGISSRSWDTDQESDLVPPLSINQA